MPADLILDGSQFRMLSQVAGIGYPLKVQKVDGRIQLTLKCISVSQHLQLVIVNSTLLGCLIHFGIPRPDNASWMQLVEKSPGSVAFVAFVFLVAVFGPGVIFYLQSRHCDKICPLFEYDLAKDEISLRKQTELLPAEQFAGFLIYREYSRRLLIVELQALYFKDGSLSSTLLIAETELMATSQILNALAELSKEFPTAVYQQTANTFCNDERCNDVKRLM